jgi:RHS repeat-associated protein
MAGISSNALKGMNYPQNRKKYNGIEFTEDLDLDIYDAQLRNLDPQIGRWSQIDPKIENMEMWSPYASNYDNPIRYNDFLGDEPGGPNDPIAKVGMVTGRTYNLTRPTDVKSSLKFAGQYTLGLAQEGVALVNQNINPLYLAGNGLQALATGKDLQSGQPMNGVNATISIAGMLERAAGALEGMLARSTEKVATQVAEKGPIVVNESTIAKSLEGSTMKTVQDKVSIPAVERYVRRLEAGSTAPAIKVADGIIVDGNHRYVAGRLFGTDPATAPGTISRSQIPLAKPVQDLKFDPLDWGNK